MPLQATSGAASYDAFGGGVAVVPTYIEDVFSCFLYTGNSSTQTINNGIDLAGKGGLVWLKGRSLAVGHYLYDTNRGIANGPVSSENTNEAYTANTPKTLTSFNTDGFSMQDDSASFGANVSPRTQVSWTFRKQPKFFDVVTYTGTGSNRTIAHSLGSVPACIIVKRTDTTGDWQVYHRSLANTEYLVLNSTAAKATGATRWNSTTPTSSVFSLGTDATVNASGGTYVAYIFAHDAGGFGLTGTDNVVSCGAFNTDAGGKATVNLGYEPQWVMFKRTDSDTFGNWYMVDNMRGFTNPSGSSWLWANTSGAEQTGINFAPESTGFNINFTGPANWIYIAIRRGPMKVPTTGTSVFAPTATAVTTGTKVTTGFVTDLQMANYRSGAASNTVFTDRLRGISNTSAASPTLGSANTNAEITTIDYLYAADNTGWRQGSFSSGGDSIRYDLRRAPGFFDEVCYTGTGSATTFSHNLQAVPEMMIVKNRDSAQHWAVYVAPVGNTSAMLLNLTNVPGASINYWNNTTPTSSVFSVGPSANTGTTAKYVAYLFATCAGVSKVFSYTGNGSSQTINCGFTAGARFVLIKRTDSTGGWYVWDTARGIVSGNDPHLRLNSTAAEVTTDDTIDTDNTGFVVNQVTATDVNVSSATYIGLAIA